jgi:hypothetical protein
MRYVSGTDMRQMIKKRGRILPATALFLLGQAARALDAAHRKGLVHRDVKPGNLLIERGSDEADPDHVYLADFGITKHAMSRSGLTSTGQFLGTIDYVAPEQIRGTWVAGQADQYSLGCVLYECLTGRVPFEKDLDAAIIWAHVEETPTMPTVLRPDLPPEIDGVFGRVLAKRPDERYGSCREFVEAARVALGVIGPGTATSLAFGGAPAGPPAGAPSGGQAGVPPDRFSWSSMTGQAPAAEPVAPVGIPAGPPSGSGQSWGRPPGASHPDHSQTEIIQAGYGQPGHGQPGHIQPGYGQPGHSQPGHGQPGHGQPGHGQPEHGRPGYDQPGSGRSGSHHSGGTIASHRREYGTGPGEPGQPAGDQPPPGRPGRPHWYRQPRWLALLAVLILAVAGLGIWAGLSGSSSHNGTAAMPSMSATPKKPTPSALMSALRLTNQSSDAKGLLPPSTCKQQGANMVTCVAPAPGINKVDFYTYPSLTALYNAYMAEVASLSSPQQFKQNYNDCELEQTVGEVGWNHQFQHMTTYTVAEMSAGKVTDDQAAGRVFCNFSQGLEYMVWTQDDGHVLGVVAGAPHENVWNWWLPIHHNIPLGGNPMNMPMPGSSPSMSPSMSPSTKSTPSS